jgi:protein ImuB
MRIMLWLCICFPRLPFDALSLNDKELSVITLSNGRSRRILVSSKAAQAIDISAGLDYALASTLCVNLKAIERNSNAERKALERLAAWAYQWSSTVTLRVADPLSPTEHSMLWLEIEASFKLFGGRTALLKRVEDELQQLHYDYLLGIACSLEGAALLARANKRVVANSVAILRRHIAALPIALLALDAAVLFELNRAGIRTIETFIDLPKDAIARRFGPKTNDYLDRLLGLAPDPRPAFQMPKKYRARYELGAEVSSSEALLFPLRRMLQELQGYLRAIDGGVQSFIVHLHHRQGSTRVAIGLSAPERRAEQFFAVVRERLERLSLVSPVLEMRLQADHFTQPAVRQTEIFADAQEHTEQFQQVFDKLTARLGANAIHRYALAADHRPERAAAVSASNATAETVTTNAPRPLWLLAEPRRIAAPATTPAYSERIASGWWDGGDVTRDYYFLRTANGAGFWIYRDDSGWFLHGLCG